jgi:bifunctional non-homologous end joining protein LigD
VKRDDRVSEIAKAIGPVQTATLVRSIPNPHAFTFELKWDGYRIVAIKAGDSVRLVSRKAQDYSAEFASVVKEVAALDVDECAIDGEICALDERGVPSFQLLQNRGRKRAPIAFFVFDLLWVDGEDLRDLSIEKRRARLSQLLPSTSKTLVVSTATEGDYRAVLDLACKRGLEGIVAKEKKSKYVAGRRPSWLKVKCRARQEFAVVGYLPLMETQDAVGGLLIATYGADGKFHYAGKVGTGFDSATRVRLAKLLDRDRSERPTAVGAPKLHGLARWSLPKHVAEVEFTEWTEGGNIRHPSFQGLRRDKSPEECTREIASDAVDTTSTTADDGKPRVAGIAISHADRVLDPTGVTKLELAHYYDAIAEKMLPHVRGRPLTLVRWAEGKETEKGGVYLRHAKAWGPSALRRVEIQEQKKVGEYLVADTRAALVALAQMGILEVHTWNSTDDDVELPNRVVFDLDPAPDVKWKDVARAARLVRDRLTALGLESFVKTTGGKGLHVVVPLEPDADWDESFAFTRAFARLMVREDPKRFIDSVPKHARSGKILVDYLRNNRGNTSVAAYSTRARRGAPVSLPIAWDDVDEDRAKRPFTMKDALASDADAWARYPQVRQRLPRSGR